MLELINKIEAYGFECEAGPLNNCVDWKALRAELAKEREARVKYQSIVYDCCNRLDAAFSRSVRGGEGTTIDQVAPDISFLDRLRLEAIAKAEAAEAQVARAVNVLKEIAIYKKGVSPVTPAGIRSMAAEAVRQLKED